MAEWVKSIGVPSTRTHPDPHELLPPGLAVVRPFAAHQERRVQDQSREEQAQVCDQADDQGDGAGTLMTSRSKSAAPTRLHQPA